MMPPTGSPVTCEYQCLLFPPSSMKAFELFATMPVPLAADILEFTHSNDRDLYKAVVEMVAQARKVRPVFLQRQPKSQRFAMMTGTLGRPNVDMAAENLIRNWLLKKHTPLLESFLNALEIPHEKGVVENLPDTVPDAALQMAVDQLLESNPADVVAVYLWAFCQMNETTWENLDLLLHTDDRLMLTRESHAGS